MRKGGEQTRSGEDLGIRGNEFNKELLAEGKAPF